MSLYDDTGRYKDLPPAYNGCQCMCHRFPANHIVACCGPSDNKVEADLLRMGCKHDRLNKDGICRTCCVDCRGMAHDADAS